MELGPLQTKWLEELRSGKHKQCTEDLRFRDSYCCLGVAAEFVLGIKPQRAAPSNHWTFNGNSGCLAEGDWEQMGLVGDEGNFAEYRDDGGSLASLNDKGWTFTEIADFIEANPDLVFTHPA